MLPPQMWNKIFWSARRQVTDFLHYKAKMALQVGRKCIYESGNKCGKLARALREQQSTAYVPSILGADRENSILPKQIAQSFGDFYSSL